MAKKKRKRQSQAGVDPNERRRERLEARRQAKAEAEAAARRAEARSRIVRYLAYAALAAIVIWFFFLRGATPDEIDGHPISKFSESGTGQHVSGTVNYETTPPVSGEHAQGAAPCGIHGQPIPNENLVHSFEHGAVALLYDAAQVEPGVIEQMETIAGDFESHVLSAPYPEMDNPIVVASWGEKMNLDSFDGPAIREYIEVFRERGPESQDCDASADQPFQPAPSPTTEGEPSPSPEASPTG